MKKIFLIPIVSILIFGFSINNVDAIQNPLELFMPSSEKPTTPMIVIVKINENRFDSFFMLPQ